MKVNCAISTFWNLIIIEEYIANIKRIYTFLTVEEDADNFLDTIKEHFSIGNYSDKNGSFKITQEKFMEYLRNIPELNEELFNYNLTDFNRLDSASRECNFIDNLEGDYL